MLQHEPSPPDTRMPRLLPTLASIATAALLAIATSPSHAQALRVMSFNIRLPVAADGDNRWERRKALIERTLREQDADVMGMQELHRAQGDDVVRRLPHYAWFGRDRRGGHDDEHMGVFYRKDRLRVVESGDFWLSDTPDAPGSITWDHPYPRMVTWALFERIADRQRFYLFNTHLPYRDEDDDARERGARLIASRLSLLPAGTPVIVTGDFNAAPESRTHALLAASLTDAWHAASQRSGPAATFHDFTGMPARRIDWILYRGVRPVAVRTVTTHEDGRYPSDHFPIVAEFVFPLQAADD
jgi:endonuclease/exonuclease/phosphatase family metal-dependent hydrolase